jgi:hypothetical protein
MNSARLRRLVTMSARGDNGQKAKEGGKAGQGEGLSRLGTMMEGGGKGGGYKQCNSRNGVMLIFAVPGTTSFLPRFVFDVMLNERS